MFKKDKTIVSLLVITTCIWLFSLSIFAFARTTVTMWSFPLTGNDYELFSPIIEEFTKRNPDTEINLQVIPWKGRYEKMLTAIAGGSPPEVIYLNHFQIPLFASTDNLVCLTDVVDPQIIEKYQPGAIKGASYQNKVYALPILTENLGYFYNVNLFEEVGLDPDNPPEAWQEMEHAIATLTKKDASGQTIQWGARFDLNRPSPITSVMPFIWQAGGKILDEKGNAAINSPECARASTFLLGLFEKGYIQKSNITGGGLSFASGKIGVELQREPFDIAKVENENPDLVFKVGPILKDRVKIGYLTVGSYGIFSASKNKDVALKWVLFLTNHDSTVHVLKNTGFTSPRNDIEPDEYLLDPRLKFMVSQAKYARGTGPMTIHYMEILDTLTSTFNSIFLGLQSPKEALDEAAARIQEIVK